MAISWGLPKLVSKILEAVPAINYLLNALAKMDYTGTTDIPTGAVRMAEVEGGWQLQRYNGNSWVSVGKLIHDADTVDGKSASTAVTPDTIPVRDSSGKVPGDITGNAATASSAAALSTTLPVNGGGTGATNPEGARSNLGVPPTSHASTGTTYGLSSASQYGHAMAASDDPAQDTDAGSVGSDVTHFARGDHAHKKVLGTSSVYGQVKLTDSVSDGSAASSSVAASAKAVKEAYDAANKAATTIMTGATASAAGTSGNVPAPEAGDDKKCLMGDGTFEFPLALKAGNPISSVSEDKLSKWLSLGSGCYYFNQANKLVNQPTTAGFLINLISGETVFHIWIGSSDNKIGSLFCRRGSFDGWTPWIESADASKFLPITGGILTGELSVPSTLHIFAEGAEGGQIQLDGGSESSQSAVLDQQKNYFRVWGTTSKIPARINLDTGEFEGTFTGAFPNVFCGRFDTGFTLPDGGTWYAVGIPDHGGSDNRISPTISAAGGSRVNWSFGGYGYAVFAVRYK